VGASTIVVIAVQITLWVVGRFMVALGVRFVFTI